MNKFSRLLLTVFSVLMGNESVSAQLAAHFPMDPSGYKIKEEVSSISYRVSGNFMPESVSGAVGTALRFDGYSTYVNASVDVSKLNENSLTVSLWCAMESYPMMVTDAAENLSTYIAGNMTSESGFAFTLSSQGDYAFEFYANGSKVTCQGNGKLPKNEWVNLKAMVSAANGAAILYRNGEKVGSCNFRGNLNVGESQFLIGKSFDDVKMGPCYLNTINGAVDDIRIYAGLESEAYTAPEHEAELAVAPSRFSGSVYRPLLHAMPSANWTNETHGLIHYNGKYHLFFQKNGNGPYMARLHWGHLSSEDLIRWKEEPIAVGPSEWYDIKGTWSGCVYNDDYLTGGKPHIYYTAVDNGRASVAEAAPLDDDLIRWTKNTENPVIPHRPDGLGDDFRDTYIFSHNGEYYMVVGTSKDGKGAATLHHLDKNSRTWSNDGKLFFQSNNANISGTFWEMPAIFPLDGKWVFITTPLGSAKQGVEAIYWVGDINDDGTFSPLPDYVNEPKEIEMGTFGQDGYGLLSPSVMTYEGKTIALGIVPDKLPLEDNARMGWAHTYSFPREWSLDANYALVQKPFEGLSALRTSTSYTYSDNTLSGSVSLSPVEGKMVEIEASYVMSTVNIVGFDLRKKDGNRIRLYYNRNRNTLTVDARETERLVNDGGGFAGLYESVLPGRAFQTLKLHVYMDHSIMDIFVNDQWAFSLRIFASDDEANGIEAFSEGTDATLNYLRAWTLAQDGKETSVNALQSNSPVVRVSGRTVCFDGINDEGEVSFFDASGTLIMQKRIVKGQNRMELPGTGKLYIMRLSANGEILRKKILL